ncbi:MAG: peptidase M24, partial [Proteobacteria bacterium]
MKELDRKLNRLRGQMARKNISCLRLKGVDWFAWATCGGDSTVALNEEAGVAEVLVTESAAWILTNRIEAERIRQEEAGALSVVEFPWESTAAREAFVRSKAKEIHSDYPAGEERKLDRSFLELRLTLEPEEVERYRALGADAAKALTATLAQANGSMTEGDLSGLAAKACWSAGIQPMLAMAAGERRGLAFRHPITKAERLGG